MIVTYPVKGRQFLDIHFRQFNPVMRDEMQFLPFEIMSSISFLL